MKNLFKITITLTLFLLVAFSQANAQTVEINQSQQVSIPFSGFYPFSDTASQAVKEGLGSNPFVTVTITSFSGKPFSIAPAADFREIGRKQIVKSNGAYILDFRKGKKKHTLGLSFVPKGKSTSANLVVEPFAGRPCPSPVNCQDDCGGNLGKCCEKDSNGSQTKICKQVGTSSCGCANK